MSSEKPNVLIFGGLNTASRALAAYLVPLQGDRLVGNLRMVDKFSVMPPTTYLGAEFPKVLEQPNVEYRQANLTNRETIKTCFDPPAGAAPYDYVVDFTGEILPNRTEEIYIGTVFNIAVNVAAEAAERKVKAHVRVQPPFYETSDKGPHPEKEDIKPDGHMGIWWHESLRSLAAIKELNLVVVRSGLVYGPYSILGILSPVLICAAVYGYKKQPMKTLWSPGNNPMNCVHTEDLSGAIWACAEWMAPLGREEADKRAGEAIIFHNSKNKDKDIPLMQPHDKELIAPVFNIVDDSNLTHAKAGETMATFFGTTHEFHNFIVNTAAKLKLDDVVEDVNEHHVGGWTEMLMAAEPPITSTPLSAYMTSYQLKKHKLAYDNTKIKEIVGYKLKKPDFCHETLRDIVDKFKAEGIWPIVN